MYFKIAVVLFLLCMTVAVGRAEEPDEPNTVQCAVIHVDRVLREVKAELFDGDHQELFDDFMPVDDFRLYVKPKWGKSFKKGKAYYTIGFKFTF